MTQIKKMFELVLVGFDGSTDETDDRIIWVQASVSMAEFIQFLVDQQLMVPSGPVAAVYELDETYPEDFVLPAQVSELKKHISTLLEVPA